MTHEYGISLNDVQQSSPTMLSQQLNFVRIRSMLRQTWLIRSLTHAMPLNFLKTRCNLYVTYFCRTCLLWSRISETDMSVHNVLWTGPNLLNLINWRKIQC